MKEVRILLRGALVSLALPIAAMLCGCDGFFVKPTSGGGATVNTGDFAYVSNSAAGPTYLAAYNLAAGTLAAVPGSPVDLGFVPVALAVAPGNTYLYAASATNAGTPGIYRYSIATTGALTATNNGSPLVPDQAGSMALSADGNWLFSVSVLGLSMNEYKVDTSTGSLTLAANVILPGAGCGLSAGSSTPASQTCTVTAGPSGAYVAVALGIAGTVVFPYTSASGLTSQAYIPIAPATSTTGDFSVALDKSNYAFITRTNTLAVYAITPMAATLQATATFVANTIPRSVVLGPAYNYVYTASQGLGTISGFGIGSSGALSEISTLPFSAPTNVAALGVDNSGKYLIAAGYAASAGVQLYTLGATGELSAGAAAASGSTLTYPAVLALTH